MLLKKLKNKHFIFFCGFLFFVISIQRLITYLDDNGVIQKRLLDFGENSIPSGYQFNPIMVKSSY
jgi:hypothetical protein